MPGAGEEAEEVGEATAALDEGTVEPQSYGRLMKERKYLNRRIQRGKVGLRSCLC